MIIYSSIKSYRQVTPEIELFFAIIGKMAQTNDEYEKRLFIRGNK